MVLSTPNFAASPLFPFRSSSAAQASNFALSHGNTLHLQLVVANRKYSETTRVVAIGVRDSCYSCTTGRLRRGRAALRMSLKQAYHLIISNGTPFAVEREEGLRGIDRVKMVDNRHTLLSSP